MAERQAAAGILSYWFGRLEGGWPVDDRSRLWFGGRPEDDRRMLESFGRLIDAAIAGSLAAWQDQAASCAALILLADQMTRATRRSRKDAFAGDAVALAASRRSIESGLHLEMPAAHRVFAYMPLMHSEGISDQELCVQMFEGLERDCGEGHRRQVSASLRYAALHRDIIREFGRFPHRNRILGRESTAAEKRHLAENPESFGQ